MRANTKSTMRNEEMYSYQEVKNGKQVSSFRFKEKHNLILKLHTLNLTYPSGSVASLTLFVVPANSTRIFVVDCSASPKGPTPRDEPDREREESRKRREQYTCYRALSFEMSTAVSKKSVSFFSHFFFIAKKCSFVILFPLCKKELISFAC